LWALAESRERKRPAAWIFATGTLLGLAALCRPTIWPFVAAVSAWMIVDSQRSQSPRLRFGLVLIWLGVAFATAPWAIRNAVVMGKPIVTTTHGGYTLLLANNPVFYKVARQPWGAVWDGESLERWQRDMLDRAADDLGPHPDEIALDRWQSAQARQNIRRDPSGFLAATAYRVRSFWSLVPRGDSTKTAMGIASGGWYAALFAGAVWGCWSQFRRDVRWLAVLILLIASIQAVHLVYWTDTRMRAPLHPVFALFCAGVGCSPLRTSALHKPGDSR
jgi:4-amino-4-deoxy-L-arabinose transferase-like glycosyltransferase